MDVEEVWRDVPSVPGLQASSDGVLRVKPHRKPMPNGSIKGRAKAE